MAASQDEIIKYYRSLYPGRYTLESDEEVYKRADEYAFQKYGKRLTPYIPRVAPPNSVGEIPIKPGQDDDENPLSKVDTSPTKLKGLTKFAANIGTDISASGWLAEMFPEGIDLPGEAFDVSPEFFQKSYNESLAGQAYQAIYGREAYDIGDYTNDNDLQGWLAESGQFMLGMLNAPEVLAFATGSRLGLWGASKATSALHKWGLLGLSKSAIEKGAVSGVANRALSTTMTHSALQTGLALGTLGATHSATHSAAIQKMETGEIDVTKVFLDGAKGFGESFLVGAPAGMVAKGFLGSKYAMAKLASDKKALDITTRVMYGLPTQIATEAFAFTALPSLYKHLGEATGIPIPESYKQAPGILDEGFGRALFNNTVVIGTMVGFGHVTKKMKGIDDTHEWAMKLLEQGKRDSKKLVNSQERVKEKLEDAGVKIDPEMLKIIGEDRQVHSLSEIEFNDFKVKQKTVKKIIEKIESQGAESLTPKDRKQLEEFYGPVKLIELGLWEELSKNPNKLKKIIEEKENRKLSDEEFAIYQKSLEVKIQDTIDTFGKLNKIMVGVNPNEPILKPGEKPAAEGTPIPPETLVKEGLFIPGQDKRPVDKVVVTTAERKQELLNEGYNPETTATAGKQPIVTEEKIRELAKEGMIEGASEIGVGYNKAKEFTNAEKRIEQSAEEVFTYKEKGKVRTSSNKSLIDKRTSKMKDVKKDDAGNYSDITAVVDYALHYSKGKTTKLYRGYSAKVADYVNWLHKTKKKTIATSNADDVHQYLAEVVLAKGTKAKLTSSDINPFATFYEYIDLKFHPNGARVTGNISYTEANQLRFYRVTGPKGGVDTKKLDTIDVTIDKVITELQKKLGTGKAFDEAAVLSKLIKYGLRDQEVNKITTEHIIKHPKEGWYVDLGFQQGTGVKFISKDGTAATVIPIPEKLAKSILELGKNLKKGERIFDAGVKIGNTKRMKAIAQLIYGKDYDWTLASRHMLKTKGSQLGLNEGHMNIYLRHDKTAIDKIYVTETVSDVLIRHKKLQKKLGIGDEGKYQLEGVGQPMSAKELSPWLDAQIKKNPGLALRKLKDADFVGRFYEGVIDVTMGKANKFTFFHENAHRLKAMIDASGNKRLKKVWNQAEKLFKKEAKGRNMEEFLADEIARYSLKREQPATLKQKMGGWLSRVWSTVKSVFFGKERLTKNDVKNILGEKVFKGFEFNVNAKASSIARYKYATVEEFSKGLKKQFKDSLTDKLNSKEQKALEEYIAQTSGMENPELFKLGSSNVNEADLILFQERMKNIPFLEIKSAANIQAKARLIKNIELNSKKVFKPEQQQNIMKLLGFKSTTLWGANVEQLKAYTDIINSTRMPNQTRAAGIAESATTGELSDIMKQMDGLIGDAAKATLPVGAVMRKLGLKNIASKIEDHISVEMNHVGQFILFEVAGERALGVSTFKKAKEHLYLMDVERYIERKQLGLLKKSEQTFIDKAFKSDWVIQKDGTLIKNPKYSGKKFKESINKDSPEGKVVDAWVKYTDYVFESFKQSVKTNMNETEYLNFIKENNIKWIRDNIYVSRLVTDEFKRTFNLGGKAYDKLIEKQTGPLAVKLAKKKYNTDKPTDEQIGSVWEDAQMYARNDIADMLQFNKGKHSTRFLKKRHIKLPEIVEIDGKKIKVYETGYENTVKKYALGMSKFMANTEMFPEFVNLKGMNFPGRKDAINKLITANNKWGAWARDRVEQQLGYLQKPGDYQSTTAKIMSGAAQVLAKTQLSFPTSGLKNLILGQTATLQAFRMRDYLSALTKVISREFRDEVKGTGATEVGLRHIQDLKFKRFDKVLDKIFWFGGMKPTENLNRYMSIAASKVQQNRLVEIISNNKHSAKKRQKAERRLKDFYSITKEELNLLKKYGMSGVDDVMFTSKFQKAKTKRAMQNIYNKMNTMAHIKTQGASLSFFMPEWADGKFLRPLTLFKRMAYASTTNSINNLKLAYKNGDMMKMGAFMLGPYFTGTALIAINNALFDQKPPTENSSSWEHMKYVYMRGEFLGVLSDFMKMYEGESAQQTVYPALYNYLMVSGATLFQLSKGQINWGQTADKMLETTFGAYRGAIKIIDKRNNPYKVKSKTYRKFYYEFLDETFPNDSDDGIGERKLNRRSPYYEDLKTVFENGSAEEFGRQYKITLFAVASDLYKEGLTADGMTINYPNFEAAMKQAETNLKNMITRMNPNPASFLKITKSLDKATKLKYTKRAALWHKWLSRDSEKGPEYIRDIKALEGAYWVKKRNIEKELKRIGLNVKL